MEKRESLKQEDYTMKNTARNLVLYGPPGTGKTYSIKEYIDPLVTKEEMASVTAEIKSESYPKLSRLIQYLMHEYLVEDIQVERVFEAGEDFYRAKLKYKEFPF